MASSAGKLWIVRIGLIAVLAGLLAWRLASVFGGEDDGPAAPGVPATPVFDRAAWEAKYSSYLDNLIGLEGLDPDLTACALGELEAYDDDELVHELTHGRQVFLAGVRVRCDRRGAEAAAAYSERREPYGRQFRCARQAVSALSDPELAQMIAHVRKINQLARDCGA